MASSGDVEKVQNWIKGIINDPLAKILLDNSQFTLKQLETLLIDILADDLTTRKINKLEKSTMRVTNKKVSRGSFNRTLQQGRKNMTKSIPTVLLLGYIGLLETSSLNPFIDALFSANS